jgi:hypothetical protein
LDNLILTTLTHNSYLQLVIGPSLISTLYKSLEHTLSLLQPSSVFTSSCLLTASNTGCSSASGFKLSLNGGSLPTLNSSQSYFTTGGLPPISSSWRQALWDSRPAFSFQLITFGHSPYVTSSLTRGWVCRLQLLLALASSVILRSDSRGTHDHNLLSQIWHSRNLEGHIPVFISHRNRVVELYPQALGPLSQGYGGIIRPRLHTCPPYNLMARTTVENTVSSSTSTVAHWFVAVETC